MTTEKGPTQADMESARLTYEMCESASFALGLSGVAPTPENVQAVQIRRIAIALAAAREQGRVEQAARDLPAALEQADSNERLQAMLDRVIGDGVKQGLLIAAPQGHILDDKGVVRRVLGTLPVTADGCVIGTEANVFFWWEPQYGDDGARVEMRVITGAVCAPHLCYSTREAALAARGEA